MFAGVSLLCTGAAGCVDPELSNTTDGTDSVDDTDGSTDDGDIPTGAVDIEIKSFAAEPPTGARALIFDTARGFLREEALSLDGRLTTEVEPGSSVMLVNANRTYAYFFDGVVPGDELVVGDARGLIDTQADRVVVEAVGAYPAADDYLYFSTGGSAWRLAGDGGVLVDMPRGGTADLLVFAHTSQGYAAAAVVRGITSNSPQVRIPEAAWVPAEAISFEITGAPAAASLRGGTLGYVPGFPAIPFTRSFLGGGVLAGTSLRFDLPDAVWGPYLDALGDTKVRAFRGEPDASAYTLAIDDAAKAGFGVPGYDAANGTLDAALGAAPGDDDVVTMKVMTAAAQVFVASRTTTGQLAMPRMPEGYEAFDVAIEPAACDVVMANLLDARSAVAAASAFGHAWDAQAPSGWLAPTEAWSSRGLSFE